MVYTTKSPWKGRQEHERVQTLLPVFKVTRLKWRKTNGSRKKRISGSLGRNWRHAQNGWFSYELEVPPDRPVSLFCIYWGDDVGARTFDILVYGEKVATQTLNCNRPGRFFEVEYKIPPPLTRGKKMVTVKFQAQPDNTAGGVFGCISRFHMLN